MRSRADAPASYAAVSWCGASSKGRFLAVRVRGRERADADRLGGQRGPVLELVGAGAARCHREDAQAAARALLTFGSVLAVKGLGGDWVCERLTAEQADALTQATQHVLDLTNALMSWHSC